MRMIKHTVVFIGAMIVLGFIFGITGFYDSQPTLADTKFEDWSAYTLGLTFGHPLPYVISFFISLLAIRPKVKS